MSEPPDGCEVRPGAVVLTLVPATGWAPSPAPEVRLRRLLKAMLRAYGWRCVDVREVQQERASDEARP